MRRSEMIKPVFEKSRSLDTDVAGIPKYARATCDRLGYLEAFLAHHSSTHVLLGFRVCFLNKSYSTPYIYINANHCKSPIAKSKNLRDSGMQST